MYTHFAGYPSFSGFQKSYPKHAKNQASTVSFSGSSLQGPAYYEGSGYDCTKVVKNVGRFNGRGRIFSTDVPGSDRTFELKNPETGEAEFTIEGHTFTGRLIPTIQGQSLEKALDNFHAVFVQDEDE